MRVGVDTGGTFTDVVAEDGTIVKVPSQPADPSGAVAAGLAGLAALAARAGGEPTSIAHGTTVATNALLEGRGAPVVLITNAGLEDVIEIGRQDRPSLYDQWADRPPPLVPRAGRIGVPGRLDASGHELEPLDLRPLDGLGAGPAVAVCLLHSDLDAVHERAVGDVLRGRGFDVTCSHEVSPELREYERTVTTVVNAYLRPVCRSYLRALADLAPEVGVMTSAGGLVDVVEAADRPAALLLSGPAAGVRAAAAIAAANGFAGALSFDMGGTSTDVCLIQGGLPEPAPSLAVGGYPVRLPALAIHSIGAGGGSIAVIDPGGALQVGPRSAGAVPGPACYGLGGTEPTVTDADLVLGRIPAGVSFPGLGPLDAAAAADALDGAGVSAADVVAVVDAAMAQALRVVSVEQGVDPTGLALVAFGGAGPLHACALADELGLAAVVVPARAGVGSAVGLLAAPRQCDLVRSWPSPLAHDGLDRYRAALATEARSRLGDTEARSRLGDTEARSRLGDTEARSRLGDTEARSRLGDTDAAGRLGGGDDVVTETWLDCRYQGQGHELTVPSVGAFHDEHLRRNGSSRPDDLVEVIAVRARATIAAPVDPARLPVTDRRPHTGPVVLAEPDCTIWVPEGWRAAVGAAGAYVLLRTSSP